MKHQVYVYGFPQQVYIYVEGQEFRLATDLENVPVKPGMPVAVYEIKKTGVQIVERKLLETKHGNDAQAD